MTSKERSDLKRWIFIHNSSLFSVYNFVNSTSEYGSEQNGAQRWDFAILHDDSAGTQDMVGDDGIDPVVLFAS